MGERPDALNRQRYEASLRSGASEEVARFPAEAQHEEGPEQIRHEIEQTRAELSGTVDALQEKLNPQRLAEQAKDTFREATVGKAEQMVSSATEGAKERGSGFVETIKQNPLPAALAGIGIGWLVMKSRSQSSGSQLSQLTDRTHQVQGQLGQATGKVQEQASHLAHQVQGQAGAVAHQAQQQTQQAQGQFQRLLQENPLAVAGAAVALGVTVGLVLPETQREQQMLGPARDKALEQARGFAEETQHKVQRVAEETQAAAQRAAQEHLTD